MLLIEDNPGDVRLIREMLKEVHGMKFDVECADQLRLGIELLKQHEFDVVLLDLSLPDSQGFDTLSEVGRQAERTPIIVLTGFEDESMGVKAVRYGAQDYLLKNKVDSDLLARSIRYAIERKHAEVSLRESEERYRCLVEDQTEFICRCLPDGTIVFANEALCRALGMSHVEKAGHNFLTYLTDEHRAFIEQQIRSRTPDDPIFVFQNRVVCPDGELRWHRWINRGLFDQQGRIVEFQSLGMDVTDLKWVEEALHKTNQTLRTLIEASPLAIITIDLDEKVRVWNPAAESVFGWAAREVIGCVLPIVGDAEKDSFYANLKRVLEGEMLTGLRVRRRRKDSSLVDLNAYIVLLRDADGNATGVMAMMEDITEHNQLEAQLRQSQRLEAVGTLSGGIAHDFRNLLMGISGYAEVLQIKLGNQHPQYPTINDLLACVDRASKLVGQLLAFSRKQVMDTSPTDLNHLVSGSKALIEQFLGEHISIEWDLSPDVVTVEADSGQIEQVLLNLAINARDAMPTGGKLTVGTSNRRLTRTDTAEFPWMKPGEYAELSVTDTGVGMDDATRERIFEPFFTTKGKTDRSGLGLSVAYGIVKQHKGYICAASEVGKGSTFKVYLPLVEMESTQECSPQSQETKGGSETILLAEDEDTVRIPVKMALEGFGYRVLCASDGEEAVELFKENSGDIDLAILDLVMPKSGGKHVWETLNALKPGLKVLFISGYSTASVHQDFIPPEHMPFMSKPFSLIDLMQRIRELLDDHV